MMRIFDLYRYSIKTYLNKVVLSKDMGSLGFRMELPYMGCSD